MVRSKSKQMLGDLRAPFKPIETCLTKKRRLPGILTPQEKVQSKINNYVESVRVFTSYDLQPQEWLRHFELIKKSISDSTIQCFAQEKWGIVPFAFDSSFNTIIEDVDLNPPTKHHRNLNENLQKTQQLLASVLNCSKETDNILQKHIVDIEQRLNELRDERKVCLELIRTQDEDEPCTGLTLVDGLLKSQEGVLQKLLEQKQKMAIERARRIEKILNAEVSNLSRVQLSDLGDSSLGLGLNNMLFSFPLPILSDSGTVMHPFNAQDRLDRIKEQKGNMVDLYTQAGHKRDISDLENHIDRLQTILEGYCKNRFLQYPTSPEPVLDIDPEKPTSVTNAQVQLVVEQTSGEPVDGVPKQALPTSEFEETVTENLDLRAQQDSLDKCLETHASYLIVLKNALAINTHQFNDNKLREIGQRYSSNPSLVVPEKLIEVLDLRIGQLRKVAEQVISEHGSLSDEDVGAMADHDLIKALKDIAEIKPQFAQPVDPTEGEVALQSQPAALVNDSGRLGVLAESSNLSAATNRPYQSAAQSQLLQPNPVDKLFETVSNSHTNVGLKDKLRHIRRVRREERIRELKNHFTSLSRLVEASRSLLNKNNFPKITTFLNQTKGKVQEINLEQKEHNLNFEGEQKLEQMIDKQMRLLERYLEVLRNKLKTKLYNDQHYPASDSDLIQALNQLAQIKQKAQANETV